MIALIIRSIALVSLVACSSFSLGSTFTYKLLLKGKNVGTAVIHRTGNDAEGYVENSSVEVTNLGEKITENEVDKYDKGGVSSFISSVLTASGHSATVTARFSDLGAMVALTGNIGTSAEKSIPKKPGVPMLDATYLWFAHVKPKLGESLTYQTFSVREARWQVQTAKYLGRKMMAINGKKVIGNEIDIQSDRGSSTIYEDDDGELLLSIQPDGLRIERVSGS